METIYKWEFSTEKDRSSIWYVIAFAIILWLTAWWIFERIYIFSFLVLLASGLYMYLENSSDENVVVKIVEDGIFVNSKKYLFKNIRWYQFVKNDEEFKKIRFIIKAKWIRILDFDINDDIMNDLDSILPEAIEKMDDVDMTSIEKFIEIIKL